MEPAYLAGFIDGEGTIGIIHYRRPDGYIRRRLHLQITNTNLQQLEDIRREFGGMAIQHRSRNPKHKDSYDLKWCDYRCVPVLQKVLPYLKIKSEQAEIALSYQRLKYGRGDDRKNGLDPQNMMVAGLLFCRMRKLNRKGRDG